MDTKYHVIRTLMATKERLEEELRHEKVQSSGWKAEYHKAMEELKQLRAETTNADTM